MSEVFQIDRLANAGVDVQTSSRTIKVRQISLRDQGALQAIIRKNQPYPSTHAKKVVQGLDRQVAAEIMINAVKQDLFWPQTISSPEGVQMVLSCEEGQKAILKASTAKANDFTDEDIESLLDELTAMEFQRIATIAIIGNDPENDPKAS